MITENTREKFIEAASRKKILAHRCATCGHLMLETVLFCEKCSGSKFEHAELEGSGTVITYMLKVSVLEEALLAFAQTVGIGMPTPIPLKNALGKAK